MKNKKDYATDIFLLAVVGVLLLISVIVGFVLLPKLTDRENNRPGIEAEQGTNEKLDSIISLYETNGIRLIKELFPDYKDFVNHESETHHVVTVTVYPPLEKHTDSTPLITADNSFIDLEKLDKGELHWCAVSRDLLEKYPYGSKIQIYIDGEIKEYTVHDTMNERFVSYVDLLIPVNSGLGKWEDVLICRTATGTDDREELI